MTEEQRDEIEKAEGFDRAVAETVLQDFFTAKLGGGVALFESRVAGVIAYERLDHYDEAKFSDDELHDLLTEKTGLSIVGADNCDWSFDDQCDEEASYLAFGIPSLDPDYTYENRVTAQPTPSV